MQFQKKLGLIIQPLIRTIQGLAVQPLDIYQVVKEQTRSKYSYLLESCEGDSSSARYSFIGINPIGRITISANQVEIDSSTFAPIHRHSGDPFDIISSTIGNNHTIRNCNDLPHFIGGAVGYFSYDIVRYFLKHLQKQPTDVPVPDAEFVFSKDVIVIDHQKQEIKIICCALGTNDYELSNDCSATEERLSAIEELVFSTERRPINFAKTQQFEPATDTSQKEFETMVKKAKDYIKEGDIFQVVLSKRTSIQTEHSPIETYFSLKQLNPSPYLFLLEFGDIALMGSSPEMLLRVHGFTTTTKPIAGTRKRGLSDVQDRALAAEMFNDPKERAEHIMLVDLHRNDLGRVCRYGTVKVPEFMTIGKFSHVQHIVSTVEGQLDPQFTPVDALRSLFPAGTVSGAPKVRAMEIINELEKQRRGAYAGAVGYISLNGNLDFAITIRTIIQQMDKAYIQAGSGIVADSEPAKEWIESENKAAALLQALSG